MRMHIVLKNPAEFKELLIRKGYSMRGLGRAVGVSAPHGVLLANGKRNPSPKVAKKILDILGLGFDDIFCVQMDNKSNKSKMA